MKPEKKKFKPTVEPTGFRPSRKVVSPPPSAAEQMQSNAALRVKVVYTLERSRWETMKAGHPVTYRPPKKYEGMRPVTIDDEVEVEAGRASVWQKIVDFCTARDVRPEEYVRVAFRDMPMRELAPEPTHIMSDKCFHKWEKISARMDEILSQALALQKEVARRELIVLQSVNGEEPATAQLMVVTDGSLDLSPLFRYCLAVSIGTKRLLKAARVFQAEAVLQFECFRRGYKRAWDDVLPAGFSAMARRLYPVVLAKLGQDTRGFTERD